MSLDQLRYFVATAETQNITLAARRLHISQPPLSRQLRALERELGTALFDRHAQGVTLRPAGKVFLAHARTILVEVDRARRCLDDLETTAPCAPETRGTPAETSVDVG